MKVNCQEHRKNMELLSLKMQLENGVSDPAKRKEMEKRVEALEKELELD